MTNLGKPRKKRKVADIPLSPLLEGTLNLDKAISETAYALECIATLKSIQESGNCNDCADRDCIYRPKLGMMVRYNCMFFRREGKDANS